MDVGYFISELLGQHGHIGVPGLGYFARTRVNGHYNDSEGKFYPPGYSIHFDPRLVNDDKLVQYIAQSKNISLASSQYFTEKYVAGLKQQAATGEAALAGLGWFYTQGGQLFFRPNNDLNNGPEFFGYPVIEIQKLGQQQVIQNKEVVQAVTANPAYQPVITAPQAETYDEQEAYLTDVASKKRKKNLWVFTLSGLLLVAAALFLIYRYAPSLLNNKQILPAPVTDTIASSDPAGQAADTAQIAVKNDTIAKAATDSTIKDSAAKNDTVALKNTTTINDTPAQPRYEVMGGSFRDQKEAATAIRNYKSIHLEARVVEDAPGRRVKLTIGTFKTRTEAENARRALIKTKKVSKDIYTLEIKPKL